MPLAANTAASSFLNLLGAAALAKVIAGGRKTHTQQASDHSFKLFIKKLILSPTYLRQWQSLYSPI
jgi:hypothetical protein